MYKLRMSPHCSSGEHLLVNIPNESIKKMNNEICKKFRERGVLMLQVYEVVMSTRDLGCGLGERAI